ncbi:hypothetical protein AOG27_20880, partial [Pseudoalteromonas lipolytica]
DGTRDAHGDVEVRGDDLAGLAHLHVVGNEAGVHRGTRGADGRAQLVGDAVEELEVLAVAHAAATGDDHLGGTQLGTVGLGQLLLDEGGLGVVGHEVHGLDGGAAALTHRIEAGGAHGDHLQRVLALHCGDGVAGVDRAFEGIRGLDGDDRGNLRHGLERGDPGQHVLAGGGGHRQHVGIVAGGMAPEMPTAM